MTNYFTTLFCLALAGVGAPARAAVEAPAAAPPPPEFPSWTLSVASGPVAMFESAQSLTPSWNLGGQLEGHLVLGRWFTGVAIDVGPRDAHPFGGALLFGAQQSVGRLRFEGSAGGGVEELRVRVISPGGEFAEKQAAGYGRAALAASYALMPELDVLVQLTGHLTATDRADAVFVCAALGLRLRLP